MNKQLTWRDIKALHQLYHDRQTHLQVHENPYIEHLLSYLYITIEKYTIFQLKSIPVLIVCEDKKSYLNAG